MERLTKRLPGGGCSAEGRGEAELMEALARFEDQYESIELELKLVKQNLQRRAAQPTPPWRVPASCLKICSSG